MASAYAKGTRIWLPDPVKGWSAGTVSSLTHPTDASPSSEVILAVTCDGDEGAPKTLKFPLAVLSAASDGAANNVQPATPPPGQDAVPPLRNPPLLESSEDLASLSNLNEPSGLSDKRIRGSELTIRLVLHAIATRYALHLPYTYSGIVLVCAHWRTEAGS